MSDPTKVMRDVRLHEVMQPLGVSDRPQYVEAMLRKNSVVERGIVVDGRHVRVTEKRPQLAHKMGLGVPR